jgi:uncharacterized protein (DUF362 family)
VSNPILSVILDPNLGYPDASEGFSPDESFPEYRYASISKTRNDVYRAVRECIAQTGLDNARYGSPEWNPLAELVMPGSRVFVLCNFVQHRRPNESTEDFLGKCTHGSVVRAIVDYLLIAVGESGRVTFGNAPLQSANWQALMTDTGAQSVVQFYKTVGAAVEARDLRLLVSERGRAGDIKHIEERDEAEGVLVDLGERSMFSDLNGQGGNFRVSDYDPARTQQFHSAGRHRYVISREVLNSDVVFSLPKLKTHQKVGLTCGLKGFVGAVAHKDCLAHHRFGSPKIGGDEYPVDPLGVKQLVSRFHDSVQGTSPKALKGNLLRVLDRVTRHTLDQFASTTAGSWYGNDTAWRMASDVSRILVYGNSFGLLTNVPQRRHLMMVDGVIGGQGEGPLAPEAIHSGALIFSDDVAMGDWAAARLIGFDPRKVPLLREAFNGHQPLSIVKPESVSICFNGSKANIESMASGGGLSFEPPRGWLGHIEFEDTANLRGAAVS